MNDRQIDQVLVERAQKGDNKAFEMLMSKNQRRLNIQNSRFIQDEHEEHEVT
ncbi:RNA polymerase sigma factor RpoE, partial [Neisseria sp. P0001.S006]